MARRGTEVTAVERSGAGAEAAVNRPRDPGRLDEASAAGTRPRLPAGTVRDTKSPASGQTSCGFHAYRFGTHARDGPRGPWPAPITVFGAPK